MSVRRLLRAAASRMCVTVQRTGVRYDWLYHNLGACRDRKFANVQRVCLRMRTDGGRGKSKGPESSPVGVVQSVGKNRH
jgi:hypothetical protein